MNQYRTITEYLKWHGIDPNKLASGSNRNMETKQPLEFNQYLELELAVLQVILSRHSRRSINEKLRLIEKKKTSGKSHDIR